MSLRNIIREEMDDLEWIRNVKATIPFDQTNTRSPYTIEFTDVEKFIKQAVNCGVSNAEDVVYDTDYVRVLEKAILESGAIYCGDSNEKHYEGYKHVLNLNFFDINNNLIHSAYWVAEDQEVDLLPY